MGAPPNGGGWRPTGGGAACSSCLCCCLCLARAAASTALHASSPPLPTHRCRCEPGAAPLRVALLLSGGVDSSLALHLLRAAGHQVTAFYLQIWFQEDFRNYWDSCPWEEDLEVCRAVCDRLGVRCCRSSRPAEPN